MSVNESTTANVNERVKAVGFTEVLDRGGQLDARLALLTRTRSRSRSLRHRFELRRLRERQFIAGSQWQFISLEKICLELCTVLSCQESA